MATTITSYPALVTAPDTNDNEIIFNPTIRGNKADGPTFQMLIEIVAGTFRFRVGGDPSAAPTYTTGDTLAVTVEVGAAPLANLHYKAANAAESFKISG